MNHKTKVDPVDDASESDLLAAAGVQEEAWAAGRPLLLSELPGHPALWRNGRTEILLDVIYRDLCAREQRGLETGAEFYVHLFPHLEEEITDLIALHETLQPSVPESPSDGRNATFSDRYTFVRAIGVGGLGVVGLYHDRMLDRNVAVKQIRPEFSASPVHRQRFQREAEITASLQHAAVVPVYDIGSDDLGETFYSMKYIDGIPLSRHPVLDRSGRGDASEQLALLVHVVRHFATVCRTVGHAHRCGIIHRDIKPANILLGNEEAWLVDWGLACRVRPTESAADSTLRGTADRTDAGPVLDSKAFRRQTTEADQGFADSSLTAAGDRLGTPRFMSPEQSNNPSESNELSDVYSLGATLKFVLGDVPQGTGLGWPGRLRELAAVAEKAASESPADRYETACELAEELDRWLSDRRVIACRASGVARLRRWILSHHRVSLAGAAIAATLVLMVFVYLVQEVRVHRARFNQLIGEMEATEQFSRLDLLVNSLGRANSTLAVFRQSPLTDSTDSVRSVLRTHLNDKRWHERRRPPSEWIMAALCCARFGHYEEAETLCREGLRRESVDSSGSRLAADDHLRAVLLMSELAVRDGRTADALERLDEVSLQSAEFAGCDRLLKCGIRLSRGLCLLDQGQYDQARQLLEQMMTDLMVPSAQPQAKGIVTMQTLIAKTSLAMDLATARQSPGGFSGFARMVRPLGFALPGPLSVSVREIYLLSETELMMKIMLPGQ